MQLTSLVVHLECLCSFLSKGWHNRISFGGPFQTAARILNWGHCLDQIGPFWDSIAEARIKGPVRTTGIIQRDFWCLNLTVNFFRIGKSKMATKSLFANNFLKLKYKPLSPRVLVSVDLWGITRNRLLTSTDS